MESKLTHLIWSLNVAIGGGILITDWYNENDNYEDFIKISIRFLTNEIRSDALDVKVYTKKCKYK